MSKTERKMYTRTQNADIQASEDPLCPHARMLADREPQRGTLPSTCYGCCAARMAAATERCTAPVGLIQTGRA